MLNKYWCEHYYTTKQLQYPKQRIYISKEDFIHVKYTISHICIHIHYIYTHTHFNDTYMFKTYKMVTWSILLLGVHMVLRCAICLHLCALPSRYRSTSGTVSWVYVRSVFSLCDCIWTSHVIIKLKALTLSYCYIFWQSAYCQLFMTHYPLPVSGKKVSRISGKKYMFPLYYMQYNV